MSEKPATNVLHASLVARDALLAEALPYLNEHRDDGPEGAGWKSDELIALIAKIEAILSAGADDG